MPSMVTRLWITSRSRRLGAADAMYTSPRRPDSSTASEPSIERWSLRDEIAEPRNVLRKFTPLVKSASCGTRPAGPFHQALPAARARSADRGSPPRNCSRNPCPLKYATDGSTIASSFTVPLLTDIRLAGGWLLTWRSMVHWLPTAGAVTRAPLTIGGGGATTVCV